MISLQINTEDLTSQFDLSPTEVKLLSDRVIKTITNRFANIWEEEARMRLHSTRERYINNLSVYDEGLMKGSVILNYRKDPLVYMLEEGVSTFDMKLGFSHSSKRKIKKGGGWYLTIPFRIGTPGSLGESSSIVNPMPNKLYGVIKKKAPNLPISNKDLPSQLNTKGVRPAFSSLQTKTTINAYQHKSPIFQGVMKKKDNVTGQNTYLSFRRVSDNSDFLSWRHPGLIKHNLAQRAMDRLESNIEFELRTSLDEALSSFIQ